MQIMKQRQNQGKEPAILGEELERLNRTARGGSAVLDCNFKGRALLPSTGLSTSLRGRMARMHFGIKPTRILDDIDTIAEANLGDPKVWMRDYCDRPSWERAKMRSFGESSSETHSFATSSDQFAPRKGAHG